MIKQLLLTILCLAFYIAHANRSDSSKKVQIQGVPSVFYTPETRLGFGGILYTYFKVGKANSINRKSNTQTYASVTINKQFAFENDYQLWLKENKFYLSGSLDYKMFPEFFYGIGNETMESDRKLISFNLVQIHSKFMVRVKKNFYAGLLFHCQNLYNQDINFKSFMSMKEIVGTMDYTAKGIGPVLMIDHRNNPLNPSTGSYIEASYVDFNYLLPNRNKFNSLHVDLRKYKTFFKKLIWNGNLYFASTKGDVPYKMLPEIGGARFLRGYYRGRFRDNNMIILQNEFRMPVYKRVGLAAFGGVGEVAGSTKEFTHKALHYNYGFGLRLQMNKKENANIRIDYGITKDSHGLYIVFAEAF